MTDERRDALVQIRRPGDDAADCPYIELCSSVVSGATNIDTLSIDWPSGRRDSFERITANQHLRISEGET